MRLSNPSKASPATTPPNPAPSLDESKMLAEIAQLNKDVGKFDKFKKMLEEPNIDLGMHARGLY